MRAPSAVCVAVLLAGCSAVEVRVSAAHVSVPVSASPVVHDSALRVCRTGSELEKVGQLSLELGQHSSHLGVEGNRVVIDLSDQIEAQVKRYRADAVTNVVVALEARANGLFAQAGSAAGTLTGDLVRQVEECTERDEFEP